MMPLISMPVSYGMTSHARAGTMRILSIAAALMIMAGTPLFSAELADVLAKIERVASLGDKSEPSLSESIADGIEGNQATLSKALTTKLSDNNLTDQQRAAYVWALGLTKDQTAVGTIEALYKQNKTEGVRANCFRALAMIGGQEAGKFLMAALDDAKDKDMRFEIFNMLGQMQCVEALPKTEEILKRDAKELYWQPVLVFGKMGDKAVPFLLTKINDEDINVRSNAINLLGQWLIAPEAAKPLYDLFWKETNTELRCAILSSLGQTIVDLAELRTILEQVVAREKDGEVVRYAQEALDNLGSIKSKSATCALEKKPSVTDFQYEYDQLMKSYGRKGNLGNLGTASTLQDEPKLKILREYILRRDTDEAFYDYQKVNGIITLNRITSKIPSINSRKP